MTRRCITAFAALSLTWPGSGAAADLTAEQIEAYAERTVEEFGVTGLAITVVTKDSVIFRDVYGVRDVRTGVPIDENTLFPFASISKAFTTTALAMAVDEGKLGWDDPVRNFIPEFEMSDPYITAEFSVRDLVTHRSGLPVGAGDLLVFPDANPEVSDILAAMKHIPPSTSFRAGYAYDNLLYVVAGDVLARVEGRPWHEVIERRIFKPLKMKSCKALPSEGAAAKNSITQHLRTPGTMDANPVNPLYILGDNVAPAGGLSCSIKDLSTWGQFWLNEGVSASGERLISEEQFREVWTGVTPQRTSYKPGGPGNTHFSMYGLGWGLRDYNGTFMASHGGGLLGATSYFGVLPEKDIAVFVTSNISNFGVGGLSSQIIDDAAAPDSDVDLIAARYERFQRFQEQAKKDSGASDDGGDDVAIEPVRPLADYVGTYVDPWYGPVSIEIRGGALFIDMSRSEILDAPLIPVEPDKFVARWPDRKLNADAYVIFSVENGAIGGMTMEAVSDTTDFSFDFHDLNFVRKD